MMFSCITSTISATKFDIFQAFKHFEMLQRCGNMHWLLEGHPLKEIWQDLKRKRIN